MEFCPLKRRRPPPAGRVRPGFLAPSDRGYRVAPAREPAVLAGRGREPLDQFRAQLAGLHNVVGDEL
jgi:hypothetical protein